jgi:hypothetical protein
MRLLDGTRRWRVVATGANTSGDGIHSVCQQSRFADPRALAAVVRVFRASGSPAGTAVQAVEVSRSPARAAQGFATTLRWFAGCRAARLQLLDTRRVTGVGDRAVLLTLRLWRRPVTSLSVAIARTGAVTTSTVVSSVGGGPPGPAAATRSLAESVDRICAGRGTTGCVRRATYRRVRPPLSGEDPGVLAVVDLPPVGGVDRPWVGTRVAPVPADRPATSCDRAAFHRSGARRVRTRTYLIPGAVLPTRFGLTETYGRFAGPRAASAFLSGVRRSVAGCEDRDPATRVGPERRPRASGLDASAWDVSTQVSASERVPFRVGFVRFGRSVAELTFTPAPGADLTPASLDALLVRAGDRLAQLPAPAGTS